MVNKPKAKGTAAETRVVRFIEAHGLDCIRIVQHGDKDQGDIHIFGPDGYMKYMLEVKAGKQTLKAGRKQKEDWLAETRAESENSDLELGYLVIAKHGSSVRNYEVWSKDGRMFWYLDEFVLWLKGGL